jgi:hypothetical protein
VACRTCPFAHLRQAATCAGVIGVCSGCSLARCLAAAATCAAKTGCAPGVALLECWRAARISAGMTMRASLPHTPAACSAQASSLQHSAKGSLPSQAWPPQARSLRA